MQSTLALLVHGILKSIQTNKLNELSSKFYVISWSHFQTFEDATACILYSVKWLLTVFVFVCFLHRTDFTAEKNRLYRDVANNFVRSMRNLIERVHTCISNTRRVCASAVDWCEQFLTLCCSSYREQRMQKCIQRLRDVCGLSVEDCVNWIAAATKINRWMHRPNCL